MTRETDRVQRIRRAAVAVAAIVAVGLSAPAAQATAAGCATTSSFSYSVSGVPISVPTGVLCHGITGAGKKITYTRATFGALDQGLKTRICNWRMDWVYYDTGGRQYLRSNGALHTSCAWYVELYRNDGTDRTLPYYGMACAQFYVNGTLRGKQCHSITS